MSQPESSAENCIIFTVNVIAEHNYSFQTQTNKSAKFCVAWRFVIILILGLSST